MALKVDLKKLDRELTLFLTEHFSAFGIVKSVNIHRQPTPFALVAMSTPHETLDLAAQHGGSALGSHALVHLEQEDWTK
jgi:hypothetical protein